MYPSAPLILFLFSKSVPTFDLQFHNDLKPQIKYLFKVKNAKSERVSYHHERLLVNGTTDKNKFGRQIVSKGSFLCLQNLFSIEMAFYLNIRLH